MRWSDRLIAAILLKLLFMWKELDPALHERIEHIVVVMMENRSFDHMLGYLSLPDWQLGGSETIDGLPAEGFMETFNGEPYKSAPLASSKWPEDGGDPPHEGRPVAWQVAERARYLSTYVEKHPGRDPSVVMSYLTAKQVPVYDFLARQYCVCDRWFCSVPGATWPNRLFAIAGDAGGETNIPQTVLEGALGNMTTLFHILDDREVDWCWYSSDPSLLRAFSWKYRLDDNRDRFAYFRHRTERQQRNFLSDAAEGQLPAFSWVDPNFFRLPLGLDGPLDPDDDHPPHDVMRGQKFVNTVYAALTRNEEAWRKTLVLVTYDEHGGLYDHCRPPGSLGPRIPALVISPWVKPARPCHTELEHTAIIKTALRRFADEAAAESMGPRVYYANDVWDMLDEKEPRDPPEVPDLGEAVVTPADLEATDLPPGGSTIQRVIEVADRFGEEFGELQQDLIEIFRRLRGDPEKMPDRQP